MCSDAFTEDGLKDVSDKISIGRDNIRFVSTGIEKQLEIIRIPFKRKAVKCRIAGLSVFVLYI
jgi:hypothetical protein